MDEHFIKIHKWLYPVSWIYGAVVVMRNKLFDWGIFRSKSFDVPVICVGNLAVGGTGKTPHTEYLIKLLRNSYHVAVLLSLIHIWWKPHHELILPDHHQAVHFLVLQ